MRRSRLVLLSLGAAALGALAGSLSRPSSSSRPAAVEAVLRAVDENKQETLARALEAAGPAERYDSPWKEEVLLGQAVLSGDADALWQFATDGPPAPARARALLFLRSRATDVAAWRRLEARLESDYPSSWARRPEGSVPNEGGR